MKTTQPLTYKYDLNGHEVALTRIHKALASGAQRNEGQLSRQAGQLEQTRGARRGAPSTFQEGRA
jgi:hypothetical protein